MTPEALRSLIAGAETLDVEFKGEEARASLSDGDLVEAVVCLGNRPGNAPGWLLVGVEDDGRVTGARPRHADRTDPLRLQALIAHRTRPSLSARVQIVRLGDQDVIAVEVPAARAPVGTSAAHKITARTNNRTARETRQRRHEMGRQPTVTQNDAKAKRLLRCP